MSKSQRRETVVAALSRLTEEVSSAERQYPAQRLAVVTAELASIQQELKEFEETTKPMSNPQEYAKTMHQMFVSLDLYKTPILALDNQDFIANVNRKEMRRLEQGWLRRREAELQKERRVLHAQVLRVRALYRQLQHMLERIWSGSTRPGLSLESDLARAQSLRDGLALATARLRAASEYARAALRLFDDALAAWKYAAVGRSGWERTLACSEACGLLVRGRCGERGARRVLATPAAPRAARALRLALDYAFTDTMHDHRYQRATEIFLQFKETLVQLVKSIHQVLMNNIESLAVAEKDFKEKRKQLLAARINDIVRKGFSDLQYEEVVGRFKLYKM
ncbi:uncharacterized protein LOC121732792 [Aricia agestis]|uniref:uncharacterized protein LOC121732792 n=1 Tax=Aricia agestis TaxID=91739 RepID=UPI001C205A9A|nr:uncharacterized protein LOC121732792 [Aricia agestis]